MKKELIAASVLAAMSMPATAADGTDAILRLRDERKKHPEIISVEFPGSTKWREAYDAIYSHGAIIENPYLALRIYMNESQAVDVYLKQNPGLECRNTAFYSTPEAVAAGQGTDVLKVGKSIGAGSFRGFNGREAVDIADVESRGQAVTNDSTVTVTDRGWLYNGHRIDVCERYTAHANSAVIDVEILLRGVKEGDIFCTGVQKLETDNRGGFTLPATAYSSGKNAPDGKKPELVEAVALRVECDPANLADTVETDLNYLLLLKPDKDGYIRYTITASRPQ